MAENDDLIHASDIAAALVLLTRLPVRLSEAAAARGAHAAWAWPLVGALVAGIAGIVALVLSWLGLPPALTAGLVLAVQIALTGGLHEDGLADMFDGLWGGQTRERRLDIMKDSRIGSYGVMALILSLGLRWQALALLVAFGHALPVMIAAGALSRIPMAAMMQALPNARGSGLSASVGKPGWFAVALGVAIGLVIAVPLTGTVALLSALAILAVTLALAAVAHAKIGGQTGDILGASQQLGEIAALLALSLRPL